MYIVDNLPNQLDIKDPLYMDDFETERMIKGISINQYSNSQCIESDCWGGRFSKFFLYENTDGSTIPRTYGDDEGSKIFLITINGK